MAAAAIRTYFQCEACDFGSFEIKEIELHMHETHAASANVVEDDETKASVMMQVFGEEPEDDDDDVEDEDEEVAVVDETVTSNAGEAQQAVELGTEHNCSTHATTIKSTSMVGVDSNSDSDPSDVIWSNGAVRLLIALVRDDLEKFASPSTPKHYLWKGISWKMSEKGYSYTHVRCDNKWRSLKKTYRNARQLVRAGKTDAKKWKFYDVMDEFMAEQELEAENGTTGTDDNGSTRRQTASTSAAAVAARKRRKRGTTMSAATDNDESEDKVETDRERRHREKMEQMKRFNDLFELFVSNNKSIDSHQKVANVAGM